MANAAASTIMGNSRCKELRLRQSVSTITLFKSVEIYKRRGDKARIFVAGKPRRAKKVVNAKIP
jgi:hypothetical protein